MTKPTLLLLLYSNSPRLLFAQNYSNLYEHMPVCAYLVLPVKLRRRESTTVTGVWFAASCLSLLSQFTSRHTLSNSKHSPFFFSPFWIRNYTSLRHHFRVLSTVTVNVVIYVLACYSKLLHVSSLKLSHVCICHKVLSGAFNRWHDHISLNK